MLGNVVRKVWVRFVLFPDQKSFRNAFALLFRLNPDLLWVIHKVPNLSFCNRGDRPQLNSSPVSDRYILISSMNFHLATKLDANLFPKAKSYGNVPTFFWAIRISTLKKFYKTVETDRNTKNFQTIFTAGCGRVWWETTQEANSFHLRHSHLATLPFRHSGCGFLTF